MNCPIFRKLTRIVHHHGWRVDSNFDLNRRSKFAHHTWSEEGVTDLESVLDKFRDIAKEWLDVKYEEIGDLTVHRAFINDVLAKIGAAQGHIDNTIVHLTSVQNKTKRFDAGI